MSMNAKVPEIITEPFTPRPYCLAIGLLESPDLKAIWPAAQPSALPIIAIKKPAISAILMPAVKLRNAPR